MRDRTSGLQVLYIMGTGRSGSTALGIALGNVPGLFYGGELHSWVLFGGRPKSERPATVELWSRVAGRMQKGDLEIGRAFSRGLEHHRSLLRRPSPELVAQHRDLTKRLVTAILEETGADAVVDSSHYPQRAAQLRRNPHVDAHIVHLVRNPVAVIDALQKTVQRKEPMGVLKANAYSLIVWVLSTIQYARVRPDRRIRVRYEDFLDDPCAVVARICERFDVEGRLANAVDLPTGRVFQGNRLREAETISIGPQPVTRVMSRGARLLTAILQLPVLIHHGYVVGRRRARPRDAGEGRHEAPGRSESSAGRADARDQ